MNYASIRLVKTGQGFFLVGAVRFGGVRLENESRQGALHYFQVWLQIGYLISITGL